MNTNINSILKKVEYLNKMFNLFTKIFVKIKSQSLGILNEVLLPKSWGNVPEPTCAKMPEAIRSMKIFNVSRKCNP